MTSAPASSPLSPCGRGLGSRGDRPLSSFDSKPPHPTAKRKSFAVDLSPRGEEGAVPNPLAAHRARGHIKERGMRGAKRPRPVFSGQPLGAPLSGIASAPFPAYHLFRWRKARRYGPEPSNSGGGEEAARGGPLLRPRGLIATRSRKWLPPLAVVLERRGPTPHDRDGLGHASLMGQGWAECSAGAEGGDKWCRDPLSARSRRAGRTLGA